METFCEIILDLETELSGMKNVSEDLPEQLEYAIGQCKVALDRMRVLILKEEFPDQKAEILFFKKIKPAVYSKLLYYQKVFELESNRYKTDKERDWEYFQRQLNEVKDYMSRHQVKVQYYHCNFVHLDEQYFLRNKDEIPLEVRNNHQLMDEKFFTWHDHTFSTIVANEMLVDYIRKELSRIERPELDLSELFESNLYWTGKKIEIIEVIYSLFFSKSINHGKVTIKELSETFGKLLHIDLKDIYRFYTDIQQRVTDETKFLDHLRAVLLEAIEERNK